MRGDGDIPSLFYGVIMKIEETKFWKGLLACQKIIIGVTLIGSLAILAIETLGRPIGFNFSGYEELLIIAIFWLYMFGCGHGSAEESQITADILGVMMKKGLPKNIVMLIRYALTLILGAIMLYWSIQLTMWAVEQNTVTSVYRIPRVIGYACMPLGLLLTTFYNIVYFIREINFFIKKEDHPAQTDKFNLEEVE